MWRRWFCCVENNYSIKAEEGHTRQVSGRRQKTAYSGTDRIPFSLPKFFAETRREYSGE